MGPQHKSYSSHTAIIRIYHLETYTNQKNRIRPSSLSGNQFLKNRPLAHGLFRSVWATHGNIPTRFSTDHTQARGGHDFHSKGTSYNIAQCRKPELTQLTCSSMGYKHEAIIWSLIGFTKIVPLELSLKFLDGTGHN